MLPNLFADICPPVQGSVLSAAHTTTAARYQVPPYWRDAMVTFTTSGSDLHIAFGDAGVMVGVGSVGQVASSSEVLSPSWASGIIIPDGSTVSFPIGADLTHFSVDSSVASGYWTAYRSSGYPFSGEILHPSLPQPQLWLDFSKYNSMGFSSGIASVIDQSANRASFAGGAANPALLAAPSVGSGLMRASASCTAASTQALVTTNAVVAGLFDSTDAFTLLLPMRRGATGALHTLISGSTTGSSNGHWDLTVDASDDIKYTRVDSAGSSTASTYATTVSTTPLLLTLVYDGSAPVLYVNRASVSLTGTAAGDLGTCDKLVIGARLIDATYSQYATVQIPEVIGFNSALNTAQLNLLHTWALRRYGL